MQGVLIRISLSEGRISRNQTSFILTSVMEILSSSMEWKNTLQGRGNLLFMVSWRSDRLGSE